MAIVKVGKSGGAGGAVDYLLKEEKEALKQPQMIGGNVAVFGTKKEVKDDFDFYSKLKPNVKNQAVHFSISLQPGEHLSADEKIEFSEKLLDKLDFQKDKIPFLIVEHHDKDYEHWHIVAGRIREDGTTVKEWKIAERAIAATKELETEFGLQPTEYKQNGDRRTTRSEYKMMERTEDLSVIAEAKLTIDESLKEKPTTQTFVEEMQRNGFEVKPNVSATTGKMSGFSFQKNEIVFKSSSIGKQYSFQNLQNRGLDYEQERDKQYLIGIKENEFTQKLINENGRSQSIERSQSLIESSVVADERTARIIGGESALIGSGFKQSAQTESIVEGAKSIAQGTESNNERAAAALNGGEGDAKAAEYIFNSTDAAVSGTNPVADGAESDYIGAIRADFGSAQRADQDDYFNAQRDNNGDQESPLRRFTESGLFDVGGGGIEFTARLVNEIENNQIQFLKDRSGICERSQKNSAGEKEQALQRTDISELTIQNFISNNSETTSDSSISRTAQIMTSSIQNQSEISATVSELDKSKKEHKVEDLDIGFRMTAPEIEERKQKAKVEELQEVQEDQIKERFVMSL